MNTTLIHRHAAGALLGASALLASCTTVHVQTDRDTNVPVRSGATWAWKTNRTGTGPDQITDQRLRPVIASELDARGFHHVDDPSQADVLIDYHHTVHNRTELVRDPEMCGARFCRPGWDWGYYGPPEAWYRQYNYREGELVVDATDRSSGKMAWQAVGTREIDQRLSDKDLRTEVHKVIATMPG